MQAASNMSLWVLHAGSGCSCIACRQAAGGVLGGALQQMLLLLAVEWHTNSCCSGQMLAADFK
jgi:hypothetical protein